MQGFPRVLHKALGWREEGGVGTGCEVGHRAWGRAGRGGVGFQSAGDSGAGSSRDPAVFTERSLCSAGEVELGSGGCTMTHR